MIVSDYLPFAGQSLFTMASPSNKSQSRLFGSSLNPKQYRSSSCEIPRSNTIDSSSTNSTRSHRGSSPSFSHSIIINENQRPLGRYHYLHQQQLLQQQQQKHLNSRGSTAGLGLKPHFKSPSKSPSTAVDSSLLANALRTSATVGLSVSQSQRTSIDSPKVSEGSPSLSRPTTSGSIVNASDLPYILRSVSGERQDLRPGAPSEPNEYNFNFKKRGLFILINNRRFEETTGLQHREGSDLDAERLEERFQDIGFIVRRYDDVTSTKMVSLMSDAASHDHSEHDCFGCAILSHGEEGVVYAKDGRVSLDVLLLPFKADRCPSLVGKPKLFFIQACQNQCHSLHLEPSHSDSRRSPVSPSKAARDAAASPENPVALSSRRSPVSPSKTFKDSASPDNPVALSNRRSPVSPRKATKDSASPEYPVARSNRRSPVPTCKVPRDSTSSSSENPAALSNRRVPVESDCLLCYSTVPGSFSWRNNQEGSWFIQALCIVLENYGTKMELMHMLTHVNRIVAYEFASCSDKEFSDSMKQMPCIVSMLTRYVFFRPKKQDIR